MHSSTVQRSLLLFAILMALILSAGLSAPAVQSTFFERDLTAVPVPAIAPSVASTTASAKYIFLFIGDGMSFAQRDSAELYWAAIKGARRGPKKPASS